MLSIIDWRITHLCNNHCNYCYGSKHITRMSKEQEGIVISKILNSYPPIVNITGGEPMLDSNRCRSIIKKLYDGGKKVYLSTNAFKGIENLNFILKHISLLGLPLDGYDHKTVAMSGRNAESYDEVINMLSAIDSQDKNANVKIGTVVTRLNHDSKTLLEIYRIISRYACVKTWRLYEFIPVNRGSAHADLTLSSFERNEVEKVVSQLRAESNNIKIEFVTRINRSSSYFIIQPDSTVIVPVERGENSTEEQIGNLTNENFDTILSRWQKYTHNTEYLATRISDVLGEN